MRNRPEIHERLADGSALERGSERVFGLVFAIVFTAIALLPLAFGDRPRWWGLSIAGALLLIAAARPSVAVAPQPGLVPGAAGTQLHPNPSVHGPAILRGVYPYGPGGAAIGQGFIAPALRPQREKLLDPPRARADAGIYEKPVLIPFPIFAAIRTKVRDGVCCLS